MTKGNGSPTRALDPSNNRLEDTVAGWPTPATRDFRGANGADHLENGTGAKHLHQLPNFVAHVWPTPKVLQGGPNSNRAARNAGGPDLQEAAHVWRTPGACDAERGGNGSWEPKPQAGQHSLRHQAGTWSTPRSSDGEKGSPNQSFGAGGTPLPAMAANWSTPSVADVTGGRTSRSGDRKGELLLNSMAPYVTANAWPTPTAMSRPRTPETLEKCGAYRKALAGQNTVPLYLEEVAISAPAAWPTPTSLSFGDSHQPGNSRSYNRTMELAQALTDPAWPTPQTANRKSRKAMTASIANGRRSGGGNSSPPGLEQTAELWAGQTPPEMDGLTLSPKTRALVSSLQAPETESDGQSSPSALLNCYRRYRATTDLFLRSERRAYLLWAIRRRGRGWTRKQAAPFIRPAFRRQLNPHFVSWLMGWPHGWTSFECSATVFTRFKVDMRSELSRIVLPPAPAAQLSLFG